MNERIRILREILNLKQNEFANAIGLTTSSISDMERNQAPITERTIIAICSKFKVNEEWLRNGKEPIFLEYDKKHDEFFSVFKDLHSVLQDFLIKTSKNLLDAQDKM